MHQLNRAALGALPPESRPRVDPADLRTRIVHFGIGAFHRAHQALYTENAAAHSGEPWGTAAVAPRSASTADALRAQDCLYSLTERRPEGGVPRVVGALTGAYALGRDAAEVDALLIDPGTTVVTLTVTEKGYHRSPATGGLDTTDASVAADLATAREGRATTVIGRLACGLAARMRSGAAPISVVSCDNMADNGAVLSRVVRDFVQASDLPDRERILTAMAETVAFPATVVDRIVPATTPDDLRATAGALGVHDALPVTGEPYRQWVLEDRFTAPRPPWERDGALLVPDVAPYQLTKLRLLNGAHSALAHLGIAAGRTTVADAMADGWGERLVKALCAEVAPTLPDGGPDPARYADDLVARFRNPAMRHSLRQIASDSSLKITERWLPALRLLRERGAATPVLELALAGWVHLTRDQDIPDPARAALTTCWQTGPDDRAVVRALLTTVGAPDLADDSGLVTAVVRHLPALRAGRVDL
ncbi:mannitol dehydrogenase family protein [Streptomyces sp. NPDC006372]|uniref:mannitol dehydrogenase family protein n=1 Tax=Streptomyces sp. NPDC006372 TaxID=3155599 RepID=UPI0033A10F4B